jgi:hypothetical protein
MLSLVFIGDKGSHHCRKKNHNPLTPLSPYKTPKKTFYCLKKRICSYMNAIGSLTACTCTCTCIDISTEIEYKIVQGLLIANRFFLIQFFFPEIQPC